jgi:small GTP-binding protein
MKYIYYLFKILVIGDSKSGKTSLIDKFMGLKIYEKNADFYINTLTIDSNNISSTDLDLGLGQSTIDIKLQIWDNFNKNKNSIFDGVSGVIITFDISNKESFLNIHEYVNLVSQQDNPIKIVIVGCKNDLDRQVSFNDAYNFAKNNKITYFETSDLDNNIQDIFMTLAMHMYNNVKYKDIQYTKPNYLTNCSIM